ncbi:phage integrase SAM-like domain-containing protein [bacterium]|nr:phage integrase SAM-like domain-containing protein [bacterium]
MTLRQVCDRYLEWSKTSVSERTHERYVGLAENLCKVLGSKMAVNITRADIERFRLRRKDEVSGSTVNREASCLRAVFNKAILWGLLEKNPAQGIDMFPERPRVRLLREEEQRTLLEACKKSDQRLLYPIVALAMLTGLRRGELWLLNGVISISSGRYSRLSRQRGQIPDRAAVPTGHFGDRANGSQS